MTTKKRNIPTAAKKIKTSIMCEVHRHDVCKKVITQGVPPIDCDCLCHRAQDIE